MLKIRLFLISIIFLGIIAFAKPVVADTGAIFYSNSEVTLKNGKTLHGLQMIGFEYSQNDINCFTSFSKNYEKTTLPELDCINLLSDKQVIYPASNYINISTRSDDFGNGGASTISLIHTDTDLCQTSVIDLQKIKKITYYLSDVKNNKIGKTKLEECLANGNGYIHGNISQNDDSSGDEPERFLISERNEFFFLTNEEISKHKLFIKAVNNFWLQCESGSVNGEAALDKAAIEFGLTYNDSENPNAIIVDYSGMYFFLRAIEALNQTSDKKKLDQMTTAFKTCGTVFRRYVKTYNDMETNSLRTAYWNKLSFFIRANLAEKYLEPYMPLLKELD